MIMQSSQLVSQQKENETVEADDNTPKRRLMHNK